MDHQNSSHQPLLQNQQNQYHQQQHVTMAEQSQALGHSQAYNGHGHLHQQQQQLSSSMDMQLQADVTGNPVYMSTSVASIAPSLQQPQNQQPQEMVAVQSSLVQDAIPSGFMGMDPVSLGLDLNESLKLKGGPATTSSSATSVSPPTSATINNVEIVPMQAQQLHFNLQNNQHQLHQMRRAQQIHQLHHAPHNGAPGVIYSKYPNSSSSINSNPANTGHSRYSSNSNPISSDNISSQPYMHTHMQPDIGMGAAGGSTGSSNAALQGIGDHFYPTSGILDPQSQSQVQPQAQSQSDNTGFAYQHIAAPNAHHHHHQQPPSLLQSHEIMLPSVNMTSQAEAAGSAPSETSTSETKSSADVNPKNSNGGAPQAISAACLACCNGQMPCRRCTANESECVYIASRRGYKGPKAKPSANNPNKRRAESELEESPSLSTTAITTTTADASSCPMLMGHTPGVSGTNTAKHVASSSASASNSDPPGSGTGHSSPFSSSVAPLAENSQLVRTYDTSHLLLSPTSAAAAAAAMVSTQTPLSLISDRCLDSFYHHFFAAHPFVLPKTHLLRIAKDGQINHLLAAIRYIGSLFINVGTAGAIFYDEAFEMCYSSATPKDGFLVQAMVLLILGLDGNCQRQQSRKMLLDVEKIALDINLHTRPFATMYGRGIPVLEESWRRTWWDLYVIDGMFAGVHRETNFALYDVPADVALPCEEDKYINETIPTPMYLQDLEDADFSGEDREFSSFAYRIASGRILGKMMRTPEFFGPDDENIDRIETLLTNWRLHLPPSKQSSLNKDLELDEMMFQATMMNRTSANDISKMITHRVSLLSHSHFFICVITHSSIIHLSKWALYFVPYNDDDLRQQIRLHIGALNKLSSVWKAASTACGQVRGVAQEIYRGKKAQAEMPGFWEGLTADQVITSMANDESMMSEIDALTSAPVIVDSTFASVNSSGQ
ncbi:hypothetical protein HOO65_060420 [Ceratocystis lukuohia]|uniref:Xylanolytic transcriptional activator regulatory domain-containing protein n=1 Tax=Ceratocystis lukuohia TaxID=2019550 RepID=A0ABR4ME90_9PEZI